MNILRYPGEGRLIRRLAESNLQEVPFSKRSGNGLIRHYGHIQLTLCVGSEPFPEAILWNVASDCFESRHYPEIGDSIQSLLDDLRPDFEYQVEIVGGSYAGDSICDLYGEATQIALRESIAKFDRDIRPS